MNDRWKTHMVVWGVGVGKGVGDEKLSVLLCPKSEVVEKGK